MIRVARVPASRPKGLVTADPAAVGATAPAGYVETAHGHYLPTPRADIASALASTDYLDRVAPETPRPTEMLEHVAVSADSRLSARDLALHELLVAAAYEAAYNAAHDVSRAVAKAAVEARGAGTVPAPVFAATKVGSEFELPMRACLAFLGGNARRADVKATLKALRSTTVSYGLRGGRRYEDVPLLVGWAEVEGEADVVRYSLATPVWNLLATQRRYGYLELSAIAKMGSAHGVRLYRGLASRTATLEHQAEPHRIEVTVADMAAWLDVARPINVGRLGEAVSRAVKDLRHVRRFSAVQGESVRAAKRGAPVESFVFEVSVAPTRLVHAVAVPSTDVEMVRVGGPDEPRFHTNQVTWRKVGRAARKSKTVYFATDLFHAWTLAVREALSGKALTPGHGTRRVRGERLLALVDEAGANEAAFALALEEIASPDLADVFGREVTDAQRARYHRWKDANAGAERRRRGGVAAKSVQPAEAVEVPEDERPRLTKEERFSTAEAIVLCAKTGWTVIGSSSDFLSSLKNPISDMRWSGDNHRWLILEHYEGGSLSRVNIGWRPVAIQDLDRLAGRREFDAWHTSASVPAGAKPRPEPLVQSVAPVITIPAAAVLEAVEHESDDEDMTLGMPEDVEAVEGDVFPADRDTVFGAIDESDEIPF